MSEMVVLFKCPECGSEWHDTKPFECIYCEGVIVVEEKQGGGL